MVGRNSFGATGGRSAPAGAAGCGGCASACRTRSGDRRTLRRWTLARQFRRLSNDAARDSNCQDITFTLTLILSRTRERREEARCTVSFVCNRKSEIYNLKFRCQGGEIGRRARLRNWKSAISKHRFSFQKTIDLREEIARFPRN